MASHGLFASGTSGRILTANDTFQQLQSLRDSRQKRRRLALTLVEGVRLIRAALAAGTRIEALLCRDERAGRREAIWSAWAQDVVREVGEKRLLRLRSDLFRELSRRSELPELMAVVETPPDRLERIRLSQVPLLLVLDRPSNPGNLGSLIRSADAFGVDGVVVFGHAADLYSPEVVTASMGSLFAVNAVRVEQAAALFGWIAACRAQCPGLRLVGADEQGETMLPQCNLIQPTVLLMGNETRGLSAGLRAACEERVRIPMHGLATSLNLACATSVCLFEAARQRATMRG